LKARKAKAQRHEEPVTLYQSWFDLFKEGRNLPEEEIGKNRQQVQNEKDTNGGIEKAQTEP
jgi:transcription elongation factor Elf1